MSQVFKWLSALLCYPYLRQRFSSILTNLRIAPQTLSSQLCRLYADSDGLQHLILQLTEDTLLTHCMGSSKKSICLVVAVQAAGDEFMERESLVELSKKYRNDPVSFTWMDGPSQAEFLRTFGVTWEGKARVIAIKTGKKNRYAIHEGGADSADVFVDRILGGDMQFRPLKVMPELTPAYLQDV